MNSLEMNGTWIPVTEKLPPARLTRDLFGRPGDFVTDKVLVTVKSDECNGASYYVGTDIMIGRTEDELRWLMSCDYGGSAVYSQEIIAWLPLPEPYREVEE